MSSVKQDLKLKKNQWYYVLEYKDPSGKRKQIKKRGFKGSKEAKAALVEAEHALNNGVFVEPNKIKYKAFIEEWLKMKKLNIGPQTMETYKIFLKNHIEPSLGDFKLTNLKTVHIQSFINVLGTKNLSSETIRKIHSIVRNTLEHAVDMELITKNPAKKVKLPKQKSSSEIKVWNKDELKRFLEVAQTNPRYLAFHLAIYSGMRQAEILGLSWKDVDLQKGFIRVTQTLKHDGKAILKGAKSKTSIRSIQIPYITIQALAKQKEIQKKQKDAFGKSYNVDDLVICSECGTPLNPANLRRTFNNLIKFANIPRIRFHDLRHTHATFLLSQGVNIKLISERLGHSNIRITLQTYSHILPSMQDEAIKKLDGITK